MRGGRGRKDTTNQSCHFNERKRKEGDNESKLPYLVKMILIDFPMNTDMPEKSY